MTIVFNATTGISTPPVSVLGDTSGSITLVAPAVAGTNTITLPAGTGTVAVQGVSTNIVSGTSVTVSGTSVDFTSIPSWAKRVTVIFSGVSTSGVSPILLQIGSGSIVATGYVGSASGGGSGVSSQSNSTGFLATIAITAANAFTGNITISNITGNTWVESGTLGASPTAAFYSSGGTLALSGVLDRFRITTVNGTDTFDAGSINILYE